jgi:hypothetical protein
MSNPSKKFNPMNLKYYTLVRSFSMLAAAGALLVPSLARAAGQGVEELTRGPVHEAFAASVSNDPEPGMFVKIAPPALIEEVPPDQRPSGDNVSWIPGYWGWEDESTDFIWISGVWRNMPPGRQWTPGYWGEAEGQWQWTSGYWADSTLQEVSYLPKPPRSVESGPNIEAPSRNHIWISGTWVTRQERYAWRPGYWEDGQQNWSWTPAHYQWTPRGYVFIDGYWDYDIPRRGVVFAPVRFNHEYYNRTNYTYTPLVVIALNVFVDHLFLRPRYNHYYFGDYYAPGYQNDGFYASFSYRSTQGGYDPLYAQARWHHRDDRDWERTRRDDFDYYRSHEDARPARTWATVQARPEGRRESKRNTYQFAQTLPQYASNENGRRFEPVTAEGRTKISEQNKQVRAISQERRRMENRPEDKASEGADKRIQAKREKITRTPLAGKSAADLSGKEAPPVRRDHKEADTTAKGKTDMTEGRKENTKRNEPAVPSKDRSEKIPTPPQETEESKKTNRRDNATPEEGSEKRQQKKQPAPAEVTPKKEKERSQEGKSGQVPTQKERQPATPQPSREQQAKPERAKPERAKPERAKPEQAKPEQAKPEQAKPEQAKPEPQPNPNTKKKDKDQKPAKQKGD